MHSALRGQRPAAVRGDVAPERRSDAKREDCGSAGELCDETERKPLPEELRGQQKQKEDGGERCGKCASHCCRSKREPDEQSPAPRRSAQPMRSGKQKQRCEE